MSEERLTSPGRESREKRGSGEGSAARNAASPSSREEDDSGPRVGWSTTPKTGANGTVSAAGWPRVLRGGNCPWSWSGSGRRGSSRGCSARDLR